MITSVTPNKNNDGNFVSGSSTTYFPPGSTANNAAILGGAKAGIAALPDPNKAATTKPNSFSDATNPQKPASPATPAVTTAPITTPGIGASVTALPQTSVPTIDYSSAAGKDMNERVSSGLSSPVTALPTPATNLSVTGQDLSMADRLNKAASTYQSMQTPAVTTTPSIPDWNDPKQMAQLASLFGLSATPQKPMDSVLKSDLNRAGLASTGGSGFKNPYKNNDTSRLNNDPFATTDASRALFR